MVYNKFPFRGASFSTSLILFSDLNFCSIISYENKVIVINSAIEQSKKVGQK